MSGRSPLTRAMRRGRRPRRGRPRPSASVRGSSNSRAVGDAADDRRLGRRAAERRGVGRTAPSIAHHRARRARAAAGRRRRPWRSRPRPRHPRWRPTGRRSRPRDARRERAAPRRSTSSIASTGTSRLARSGSRYSRSVASNAASESLSIRTARASGCARAAAIASARPTISPAWGPPSSLSPEKHVIATPAATERRTLGSSASAGSASSSRPEPTSSITGTPSEHERLDLDGLHEPDRREVRLMRAQDRARALAHDARVVVESGAVGGPDLDQRRARRGDNLGDPERPADLHRLPARDHDVAAGAGQRGRREQHRRRAVVDRERRLGAGQLDQQALDVRLARPALPVRRVEYSKFE